MQEYITDREDVKYFWFDDEFTMLQAFLTLYLRRQPGVTTAWNGDGFDFPYIVNRYAKYDINPEAFSMFNTLEDHKTVIFGQHDIIKKPVGCYWVDTMEVYKKLFPGSRESWGLDYIAKYEKIEGKLNWKDEGFKSFKDFLEGNYSPEVDMVKGELWRLYNLPRTPEIEVAMKKQCYKLFVEYGIRDVDVLLEMDNNKKMLDLLMTLSWTMRCNLYDVFGTTKPWTIFIYNDLIEQNIALPNKPSMENREYGGGFVCATPGIFEWILIEDYASLYPNIMIQKGLSPESYVPENEIPSDLFALIKSTGIYRHIECDRIYMELDDKIKQQLSDLLIKYDLTMGVWLCHYLKITFSLD
jgi:DNA polymerase elongation subunit (family B)